MTITVNRRSILTVALVTLLLLAAYLLGSARPSVAAAATAAPFATGTPSTGITVTGNGTVTGTPDTLTVSMSATATGKTIDEALTKANKAQAAVIFALKNQGVAAKDLQTSNFSIQPNYSPKGLPSGYVVNEGVTAKIHGLGKAGAILTAAVAAGGDAVRVDNVYVAIDDTDPLKGDRRRPPARRAVRRSRRREARSRADHQRGRHLVGLPLGRAVQLRPALRRGRGPHPGRQPGRHGERDRHLRRRLIAVWRVDLAA